MLQQLLKIAGEEQLVPKDRAANLSAELVGMIGRVQVGEVVLRVEVGVADILEQLAMELIGAVLVVRLTTAPPKVPYSAVGLLVSIFISAMSANGIAMVM